MNPPFVQQQQQHKYSSTIVNGDEMLIGQKPGVQRQQKKHSNPRANIGGPGLVFIRQYQQRILSSFTSSSSSSHGQHQICFLLLVLLTILHSTILPCHAFSLLSYFPSSSYRSKYHATYPSTSSSNKHGHHHHNQWTMMLNHLPQTYRTRHQRTTTTLPSTTTTTVAASSTKDSSSNNPNSSVNGMNVNGASSSSTNVRLNINDMARTVTSVCTSGTLCTISSHPSIQGAPFGTFVDYVLDDMGYPILLMNEMSMHTINIQQYSIQTGQPAMVTLFTQLGRGGGSTSSSSSASTTTPVSSSSTTVTRQTPQGLQDVSRCSITGILVQLNRTNAPDMDTIRMRYSITHTYADQVMDSPKFAFYRLIPQQIYYVGGFGVLAKWVPVSDYQQAAPDILAKYASTIVEQINRDHIDDLYNTAQALLSNNNNNAIGNNNEMNPNMNSQSEMIEMVRMTSMDRLGIDIRVTSQKGTRRNKRITNEYRIGFRIPVQSIEDAKSELQKIFQEAWEKVNDITWNNDEIQPGESIPILKIAADGLE